MYVDSSAVKWYGDSDNLYYFSKNDSCVARLTILGTEVASYTQSFFIDEQRVDSSFLLIADFEPYVEPSDQGVW